MAARISFHRGGRESHGSATRQAYRAAIDAKAELVEFDVRRTADGELIVWHDAHLDDDLLAELTWSEVQQRRPDVPSCREVLTMANGVSHCHIDLKEPGIEIAMAELALSILDDRSTMVFTTTEDDSIRALRAHHPELVAALTLGKSMKGERLDRVVRTRLSEFFPSRRLRRCDATAVASHFRLVLPPLRRHVRRHQLTLMVWTLNNDRRIRRRLFDPDVAVVVTDRPLAAHRIRQMG